MRANFARITHDDNGVSFELLDTSQRFDVGDAFCYVPAGKYESNKTIELLEFDAPEDRIAKFDLYDNSELTKSYHEATGWM